MENLSGSSLSRTILQKTADRKGVEVGDLDPLYESIEPDALDSLAGHGFDGMLKFSYEGYQVIVSGVGTVEVTNGRRVR